ncbi:alpha-1,3-mannosyl-glycoprotein 4-beta-N-acetylglucosaminyltransferase C [Amia ocellicauda]|uniref:alpha-1,3-mannosyl-glycoprotein 4-beta-N-acetylglucosaminyltransferase C n=1 Tax=Amia ocellicauda TaxID=2972642 RepID=UPI003463AAB7
MRCYWKKTSVVFLFLLLVLYITIDNKGHGFNEEEKRWARVLITQQLNSDRNLQSFRDLQNDSLPFNVSYSFLAGFPMQKQKYLTVGLSSIKRKQGSYLLDTLNSIFTQSSEEELKQMVVVVLLADFDMRWNEQVLRDISNRFPRPILKGHLLVIHAPQEHYPPLHGLKRNFNDAPDRVYFRSKQNVDYAFLFNFCANLSRYYVMIEDDVLCSKNFFTAIKKVLSPRENSPWVTLEFSKLGYIGKLYHSSDLVRLAQFLFLFYQEMPCDWLLSHFRALLAQPDIMRFKPSLFQHIGLYSSFQGSVNRLKDEDFEENPTDVPDNPPADFFTNITTFEKYSANKAYGNVEQYFWGKSPSVGDYFTLVLHKPAVLTRVLIDTGTEDRKKDVLISARVEVGKDPATVKNKVECSIYVKLGDLVNGQFVKTNIEQNMHSAFSCLRIVVTESQKEWVIIQRINIWMLKNCHSNAWYNLKCV